MYMAVLSTMKSDILVGDMFRDIIHMNKKE